MKPILEVQNISKRFSIHHEKQTYLNIRDSISSIFKKDNSSDEVFYALDDVSFDVMPGDSIGIIGRNGAGKSTLLKILSKITPPSSGKIISRGRIASLLEVGTGFHPDLSGRENIFLNGSILGMKRSEIQKNFDAIVDFSGVEKFLDTPLKHYSSGMQLRLAFAVAAFLENEILIIDEVLAVGDAEFQKKCMGKMEDVSKSGRTILFVSHNMGAISVLCTKGILLMNGKLQSSSNISTVIHDYNTQIYQNVSANSFAQIVAGDVILKSIQIHTPEKGILISNILNRSESFNLVFSIEITKSIVFNIGILVSTLNGQIALNIISRVNKFEIGLYDFTVEIPSFFLNDEVYTISISLVENHQTLLKHIDNVFCFECLDDETNKDYNGKFLGAVRPNSINFKYKSV